MTAIPALSRGLHLLEQLAQAGRPLGFAELFTRMAMPRASLARTLAALFEAGWIERAEPTGWKTATRLRALVAPVKPDERLRTAALPLLRELRDLLDATTLFAVPRGAAFTTLAAETAEEGIITRIVGRTNDDLSRGPWGGLVFAHLAAEERTRVLERQTAEGRNRLEGMLRQFRRDGFISDPGRYRAGVLRLGVPVLGAGGLIAIFGLLAPLGQFPELPVEALTDAAHRLAAT